MVAGSATGAAAGGAAGAGAVSRRRIARTVDTHSAEPDCSWLRCGDVSHATSPKESGLSTLMRSSMRRSYFFGGRPRKNSTALSSCAVMSSTPPASMPAASGGATGDPSAPPALRSREPGEGGGEGGDEAPVASASTEGYGRLPPTQPYAALRARANAPPGEAVQQVADPRGWPVQAAGAGGSAGGRRGAARGPADGAGLPPAGA
mmetsp:Transcript_36883/g.119004  ORF Transcript_36883/g.119004 Transcript_36883/m.119004 type:complete len:205 (-) Transcript_36883:49-663(-)